ncbi:ArsR/SmtB family transcription factor [Teichococcus aestuarii]|uniref:ArsR/SmtB family transcription factor n=1 Tax=Teichococcus aestuarii TaxID=568898 RepID=UPI0036094415
METLLAQLRATAEPTRLRLLALCARGAFCVSELCAILGQSQPRLSRHLKLLAEAGLLERLPEGANVYFQLSPEAALIRRCWRACRRRSRWWPPTAAPPPASPPSGRAPPPRRSAATARTGTRCAPSTCRPPPSRTRCWRCCPQGWAGWPISAPAQAGCWR